jgi:catechol 2,3-dioxygenase-like lactoylglutathione lyase family enzyme
MARPSKFAHVVYRTRRFDEMVDWYRQVFEADVQHKDPMLAFLTYDEEHHRFAFVNLSALKPTGEPAGPRADIGVDHVAYTYANLGDLLEHLLPAQAARRPAVLAGASRPDSLVLLQGSRR